jgi:anti-sigma regulatory factor (Ser/Thr protein kinase)/serine/threonine protein phosphatase PrpC
LIQIKILDESCIGAARRTVMSLINPFNYTEEQAGVLAIITNELASNLFKYANKTGQLLVNLLPAAGQHTGVEILAIDKGPGIINLAQCLRDGHSTSGTAGTGLGAIKRLATSFDIYSLPGQGTILQVYYELKNSAVITPNLLRTGAICIPKPGEKISGDAWASQQLGQNTLFLVADGLGHGPEAATASQLACQVFFQRGHLSLTEQIIAIHQALRATRGAAIAIASINSATQQVRYAGIGNISGSICSREKNYHMVSHDGTAGLSHSRLQEYSYPWEREALLIMHSDGLTNRWEFNRYPGLKSRHPSLLASVLYRDFTRGYDDVTVVVAQENTLTAVP